MSRDAFDIASDVLAGVDQGQVSQAAARVMAEKIKAMKECKHKSMKTNLVTGEQRQATREEVAQDKREVRAILGMDPFKKDLALTEAVLVDCQKAHDVTIEERDQLRDEIERLEGQTETLHDNYRQRENELKAFNDRHRVFTEEAETRAESAEKELEYKKVQTDLVLNILDNTPIFCKDESDTVTNDVCRALDILSATEHEDVRAILDAGKEGG